MPSSSRIKEWDKFLDKKIWILIDPDKYNPDLVKKAKEYNVGMILAGGSKKKRNTSLKDVILDIRKKTPLPVVIFPSGAKDVCRADGILFTSLFSSKNIRYILEEQSKAALAVKRMKLNTLSTAYILVGNEVTEVVRTSGSTPIPYSQKKKIISLAVAAELFGFRAVYLEAGSGAKKKIPYALLKELKKNIDIPIIVGGGIRKVEEIKKYFKFGASVVVVGNALEKAPILIKQFLKVYS
ncbi:MAG: geranylgeranylglyceryl phosphate synthase family protein [Bacteroidia bacterium]|nr:geranylgeranylglyceryl phosphate synthase family protein [Bacteroidia bacterium]